MNTRRRDPSTLNPRRRNMNLLRAAIRPDIRAFKKARNADPEVTADHVGTQFCELAEQYFRQRGLDIGRHIGRKQFDRELRQPWREFHNSIAEIELVSYEENQRRAEMHRLQRLALGGGK